MQSRAEAREPLFYNGFAGSLPISGCFRCVEFRSLGVWQNEHPARFICPMNAQAPFLILRSSTTHRNPNRMWQERPRPCCKAEAALPHRRSTLCRGSEPFGEQPPLRNSRFAWFLPASEVIQRVEIAKSPVKRAFRGVCPPPCLVGTAFHRRPICHAR